MTITFVSANQRWGSFRTVGVSDTAYGIIGEKETVIKMGIGHRKEKKSFPLLEMHQKIFFAKNPAWKLYL